jgi:S-adenosyl methyltransferase/Protein of unknown function (DUF1348)
VAQRPPLPPFTEETAHQKVQAAEDAWNTAGAVRYLTSEAGIRQFLDQGTGLPTAENTHQVAHAIAPDARGRLCGQRPLQVLLYARVHRRPEYCRHRTIGDRRAQRYQGSREPVGARIVGMPDVPISTPSCHTPAKTRAATFRR